MNQPSRKLLLILGFFTVVASLPACKTQDIRSGLDVGSKVFESFSLSDADMIAMAREGVADLDKRNRVAPRNSKYSKRLRRLTKGFKSVNDRPLNFKAYRSKEVNAFAMPDGSVRVHTGLMDKMNDSELLFVIGHEVGHVAEGHSKKRFQTVLLTTAGREALGNWGGGAISALSSSQLGAFAEKVINAQFSQANEKESDDYGLETLRRNGRNLNAAVTALEKLGEGDAKGSGLMATLTSTHPDPSDRANRIRKTIAGG